MEVGAGVFFVEQQWGKNSIIRILLIINILRYEIKI